MLKIIQSKKFTVGIHKFNSQWEYKIFKKICKILPIEFHPIKVNKKIKSYKFELDIYIPKLKLAFELQGPFHFQNLKTINRDIFKFNICKHKSIEIIYLYFNKYYSNKYFQNLISSRLNKYWFNSVLAHTTAMTSNSDNITSSSFDFQDQENTCPLDNSPKIKHDDTSDNLLELNPQETLEDSSSDNDSEHSLELSDTNEIPQKKPKRVSNRKNKEKIKLYKRTLMDHYKNLESIQTEIYQPISDAVNIFRDQCPETTVHDSSIKRHILKNYKKILDCKKINNRWMCSNEKLKEIQFDLSKYKHSFQTE